MKNKLRYFMVLTALAMCFGTFSVTAYAQSNEPQEETAPVEETTEPEETATPNPFTPNGTGTVLDNATSEDEKEFYTIVTENENVFYLVIDKQRDTENVYFLNAVTESDLMALAESDAEETAAPAPQPAPKQPRRRSLFPVVVQDQPFALASGFAGRQLAGNRRRGEPVVTQAASLALTWFTMLVKAAASCTAISASTLRSISMAAFFRPLVNWL